MDTTTDTMYERIETGYALHHCIDGQGHQYNETSNNTVRQLPLTAMPVTHTEYRVAKQPTSIQANITKDREPNSFRKFVPGLHRFAS